MKGTRERLPLWGREGLASTSAMPTSQPCPMEEEALRLLLALAQRSQRAAESLTCSDRTGRQDPATPLHPASHSNLRSEDLAGHSPTGTSSHGR